MRSGRRLFGLNWERTRIGDYPGADVREQPLEFARISASGTRNPTAEVLVSRHCRRVAMCASVTAVSFKKFDSLEPTNGAPPDA